MTRGRTLYMRQIIGSNIAGVASWGHCRCSGGSSERHSV